MLSPSVMELDGVLEEVRRGYYTKASYSGVMVKCWHYGPERIHNNPALVELFETVRDDVRTCSGWSRMGVVAYDVLHPLEFFDRVSIEGGILKSYHNDYRQKAEAKREREELEARRMLWRKERAQVEE